MVYTDGLHLIADSLKELSSFANSRGLNPKWLEPGALNIHPHFKIYGKAKQRILADTSVIQISTREIVRMCRINYVQPKTGADILEWEAHHGKKIEDVYKPAEKDYDRMFKNIFAACGIEKNAPVAKEGSLCM
jgi:hypothetical protein